MEKYEGYTIALALFDYVPIAFSALALTLIVKKLRHESSLAVSSLATLGAILIVLGGLSKATWKLILSGFSTNIMALNNSLFICLSAGFLLLAYALFSARTPAKDNSVNSSTAIALIFIASGGAALLAGTFSESRYWVFYLIGFTTMANTAVIFLLVRQALRSQLYLAAILLMVNLVGIFTLSALSRLPDQTAALQWMEELCNTGAQAAFAYAAWRLYQYSRQQGQEKSLPSNP